MAQNQLREQKRKGGNRDGAVTDRNPYLPYAKPELARLPRCRSSRSREVTSRYLAADAAGAVEWGPYPFTHSDSGGIQTVHTDTTLADASGVGAKKWTFNTSGAAWQIGLTSQFLQLASVNGTVMTQDTYTWSQTGGSTAVPKIGSEPYISQKVHVMDPGSSNAQSAQSSQTVDAYGNVLTVERVSVQQHQFAATGVYEYLPEFGVCIQLHSGPTADDDSDGRRRGEDTGAATLYDNAGYNSQPSYSPCTGEPLLHGRALLSGRSIPPRRPGRTGGGCRPRAPLP
jgi:hypothetical protein